MNIKSTVRISRIRIFSFLKVSESTSALLNGRLDQPCHQEQLKYMEKIFLNYCHSENSKADKNDSSKVREEKEIWRRKPYN